MAYLIIAEGGKRRKVEITQEFLFLGAGEDNHITLSDDKIAKQHCQILRTETGFRLLDLGSGNGTWVNGQRIQQVDLKEGDVIQMGRVKMAIKDVPPPQMSAPTAGRAGAKRPGTRRRSSARGKAPLSIKKEFAAASEKGGERLVRRKLRQGSKIPGWAMGVLVFWGAVAVVAVVVYAIKQAQPSPWQETYYRAQNFEAQGNAQRALAEFQKIPRDDSQWGEDAAKNADRIVREFEMEQRGQDLKGAIEYFDNNIKGFIKKYIEAPPDKPSLAKKIERLYGPDRLSYIRVLILRRIDHYLKRYPEGQNVEDAKKLRRKYVKELDLTANPHFRDIEVEAETELTVKKYGEAFKLVDGWLKKYPDTKYKERIDWMKSQIWGAMSEQWELWEKDAVENEQEGNFRRANNIYLRFLSRCEGYDDPKAQALRKEWQRRVDVNNKRLEEQVGQKVDMGLKDKQ
jgi:hypothetical protein